MSKEEQAAQNAQATATDDRLEAVRDLLFGQNVKEYRDEFKELKDLIKEQRTEIDEEATARQSELVKRMDQMEETFNSSLAATAEKLQQQVDALSEAKTDRKALATLLIEIANKLQE